MKEDTNQRIEARAAEIRAESVAFTERMVEKLNLKEGEKPTLAFINNALLHWYSREIASCQIALEELRDRDKLRIIR